MLALAVLAGPLGSGSALAAGPATGSGGTPARAPAPAAARSGYALTLGQRGDFVSQYSDVACVGASIQMMLNLMRPGADPRPATQARLLTLARTVAHRDTVRRTGGASAAGWAYAVMTAGGGPYRVEGFATRDAAVRAVVEAMRATRRPAGLLVWQGIHAWVVRGFRTDADPASGGYAIRSLVINDPWWPRPMNSHGRTRPPGSVVGMTALAANFLPYRRGRPGSGHPLYGQYVVVLPVAAPFVREVSRRRS
jgi:hypothetical protein